MKHARSFAIILAVASAIGLRTAAQSPTALTYDGMYRTPSITSMAFGDVSLYAYMNQANTPLAPTRGHLMDHYALSINDLNAWIAKLRAENVTFREQPYTVGESRAVMIEGPSHEAIDLIEVR